MTNNNDKTLREALNSVGDVKVSTITHKLKAAFYILWRLFWCLVCVAGTGNIFLLLDDVSWSSWSRIGVLTSLVAIGIATNELKRGSIAQLLTRKPKVD